MPLLADNPWQYMALNNAWANATLYGVVKTLAPADFSALRPGFFPTICRTLNHIYEVDLYYLDALESGGLGRTVYNRDDIEDPPTLAAAQANVDMRFAIFCRGLNAQKLAERVKTQRKDTTVTEPVANLVLHLVQHQIHHRGQAHVQLSGAGVDPPQLDDFYLEFGRAPTARDYWSGN